jgi:hypothetical protein
MVGLAALLAGAGVFAQKAQEGYASIIGNQEIAERADRRTAALLAENREENREDLRAMLAAATIKTEVAVKGEVGLKSGQQVGLADGGQVSLAKGGMIGLSPDSTVRVEPYSTLRAIGQDAPRLAMLEPPATLRAIRNTAPAPPRKSAQAAPLTSKGRNNEVADSSRNGWRRGGYVLERHPARPPHSPSVRRCGAGYVRAYQRWLGSLQRRLNIRRAR